MHQLLLHPTYSLSSPQRELSALAEEGCCLQLVLLLLLLLLLLMLMGVVVKELWMEPLTMEYLLTDVMQEGLRSGCVGVQCVVQRAEPVVSW